ncbi:hypothetical protein BDV40DRAFT_108932 [Aspergillus tamarii]|uniref:Uncharacterized protein n=1 Tax=Aspergillus tamarii TaxID=41984 RepID=A0A5N6UAY9_ASPTM|nr:hypothetical protein BDV40DRAFT_108932 [Aspergillus tamarii]
MALLRQHVEQPSSTAWQPIAPKSAFHQPEEKGQLLFQRVQAENEWKAKLKVYIDQVPTAERWSKSITIPSSSLLDLILKTKELTVPVKTLNEGFQQSSTITSSAKHCYLLTEYAKANANQSRLVASFMDFLFCCVCHVACCLGASVRDVNSKMGQISRGKPAYLQEVRQGVAWQLNATDQLQMIGGWGIRSGDIVFHFPPTFKLLRLCVKRKMSIDLYINSLGNKRYTKGKENDPGMALSIPCILKCLFGSAARYEVAEAVYFIPLLIAIDWT